LAINIDERRFFSTFGSSFEVPDAGHIFLVNSNQMIISSNDSIAISSEFPIDNVYTDGVNSFVDTKAQTQVIYYRMNAMGWYLINEIPLNVYTGKYDSFKRIIGMSFLLGMALAVVLSSYWIWRITRPLERLSAKMRELGGGKFGITIEKTTKNELGYLGEQFDVMSQNLFMLVEQNRIAEMHKRNYEINMLQTQINPHFIFNTLNTIKWMAMGSANAVSESINALANILQPVFRNRSQMNTVAKELEFVTDYVKIMNIRFGEGITLRNEIPNEIVECLIPNFSLQPLVENAIDHGFSHSSYIGTITISGKEKDENVELTVSDNGAGITPQKLSDIYLAMDNLSESNNFLHGIGCVNIDHRFKLMFGSSYGLQIHSIEGDGTTVTLLFPFRKGAPASTE
jgi:sensor histidine kinase YesM